jgi:hypothetical protein
VDDENARAVDNGIGWNLGDYYNRSWWPVYFIKAGNENNGCTDR